MIRAIIFDCFGVLVQGVLSTFYDRHNFTEAQRQSARELDELASRGYITYEQHLENLSDSANIPVEQVRKEVEDNPPNEQLFSYIRDYLKPRYKIGFLSNASDNWLDELFTLEQQQLFDDVVLSYVVKMAKPDRRIFELAAMNLSVLPEECVFVDDIERYCTGAREAGMSAVRYESLTQFEKDMKELLD